MHARTEARVKTSVTAKPFCRPSRNILVERKCACGGIPGPSGECEECKSKQVGLQTKLAVNQSGDIYEQEADRIADQVMAGPAKRDLGAALPRIQRLTGHPQQQLASASNKVNEVLSGPGRPLEEATRVEMERRFRYDFSKVRVHSGKAAGESAREMNARAYAAGSHVVFGENSFSPGTHEGRRLIAHELTHVIQQSESKQEPAMIQRTNGGSAPYELISPVWNVAQRDIVVVRMKADNRVFIFYRRTGLGNKGEGLAPPPNTWAPMDALITQEQFKKGAKVEWPYFEKNPYYNTSPTDPLRGYGTQTNKDIADWLNKQDIKQGARTEWREVQAQLAKYKPLAPVKPPAKVVAGEIPKPPTPEVTGPSGGDVSGKPITSARVGPEVSRLRTAGRLLAEEAPGLLLQAALMALFPPEVHIHNDSYAALSRQKIDPALQDALMKQAATFNKLVTDDPAQSVWATVTVESDYRVAATSGGDLEVYLQDLRFLDMKLTHEYLLIEGPKFQLGRGEKVSKKVTYSIPVYGPAIGASDSIRQFRKVREDLFNSSSKVRLTAMISMYRLAEADLFLKNQLIRDLEAMLNDDEAPVRKTAAALLSRLKMK